MDTNTENPGPSFLRMERTNCSSFFLLLHFLHCMTNYLNIEKYLCIVSKLLDCIATSSFSKIWHLSLSCLPYKDLSLSHTYFGVFSPLIWNIVSLEFLKHMNPNYMSMPFSFYGVLNGCSYECPRAHRDPTTAPPPPHLVPIPSQCLIRLDDVVETS